MALGPLERRKPEPEPRPEPKQEPEPGPVNPKPDRSRRPQQHLSKEEMADAKEKFSLISRNGEYITSKDMAALFRTMDQPKSDPEIQQMIDEVDTTGRGVVDFEDFLSMEKPDQLPDSEQELREAFRVFDMNDDGFISPEELHDCLRQLGERLTDDEVDEMIREADLDGDGKIDYHEFVQMMRGAT
ncbi:hypothetical protein TRIATDRAFT_213443 [Trichoderma atroviride IMI 206040]|uniref:Calmodulin n=2 Tax=Hypocrea atroviridis TaxID=63577 RepID=G9NJ31_HYPAI|nr:uncharacterized protein TRIATDRAFT_213443 [Trichoderma atroviride IMI 206040]EHK49375.1 hypothetical protein TRIATDRAFT_213443 [Trichoderma atroviride IMI 206040]